MDEHGNIIMPTDTANVWMSEPELVGLFGVIAPTVRAGIRAVYKSGVLKEYDTKRCLRLENGYGLDVYSFEMLVALAFRIVSCGAERLRNALLKRMYRQKRKYVCSCHHSGVRIAVSTYPYTKHVRLFPSEDTPLF